MAEAWIVAQKADEKSQPSRDEGFSCAICKKRDSGASPDYFVGTKEGHDFHFACIKRIVEAGEPAKCPICDEDIGFTALQKRIEALEAQRVASAAVRPQRKVMSGKSLGLDEESRNLKFVVLGDPGVGKSALLRSYVCGSFNDKLKATVGVDVLYKRIHMNDEVVRLNLWDTAGQEQYRAIVPNYLRNAHVVLFVYSITDLYSFQRLASYWIPFYEEYGPKGAIRVIIGNKCDDEGKREVPKSTATRFSKEEGMAFFETSAKQSLNIEPAIRTAAAEALEKLLLKDDPDFSASTNTNKVRLREGKKKNKLLKDCCK